MCLQASLYRVFKNLVVMLSCLCILATNSYAQRPSKTHQIDKTSKKPIESDPQKDQLFKQKYKDILKKEQRNDRQVSLIEDVAAGVAALLIGLYGYYNDDRGVLTKIAYSATQTAGVLLISKSVLEANKPSLLLLTDKHLRRKGELEYRNYQRGVVRITNRMKIAEYKQLAYTSGILSLIYGYNGYREEEIKGLKNVFYFLSFNFLLVSVSNTYKVFSSDPALDAPLRKSKNKLSLSILPFPTVTYTF